MNGEPSEFLRSRKENYMFKKTAIITGIALAMSAGAQADYNWELGAGYTGGTISQEAKNRVDKSQRLKQDNDTDAFDFTGTWYMETVDTSKGPLGEAAFLDASSSITLGTGYGKTRVSQQNNPDGETYIADMRYVAEGPGWKLSGVIVDLGFERAEIGDTKTFQQSTKTDTWNAGLGMYITETTTLVAEYEYTSLNNGSGSGIDTYGGTIESFFAMGDGGLKAAANFGRSYISNRDDVDTYGLGATYYLGSNIGIGLNWEQGEEAGYEVNQYGVSAEWFISENFGVTLAYSDIVADDVTGIYTAPGQQNIPFRYEASYEELAISGLFRF
jgi:hypothetical protein